MTECHQVQDKDCARGHNKEKDKGKISPQSCQSNFMELITILHSAIRDMPCCMLVISMDFDRITKDEDALEFKELFSRSPPS
jgi:hypothetical protein